MANWISSCVAVCVILFHSSHSRIVIPSDPDVNNATQTPKLYPWMYQSWWAPKWVPPSQERVVFCIDAAVTNDVICDFDVLLVEREGRKKVTPVIKEVRFSYVPFSDEECAFIYTPDDRKNTTRLVYSKTTCDAAQLPNVKLADMRSMDVFGSQSVDDESECRYRTTNVGRIDQVMSINGVMEEVGLVNFRVDLSVCISMKPTFEGRETEVITTTPSLWMN